MKAPHGIPVDLLDRLLIIRTVPYTLDEIRVILNTRAKIESIDPTPECLDKLAQIGNESSLRYFIN